MKINRLTIFSRISILVFLIIAFLSALFIIITYLASTYFYKSSTELLNRDVAKHIARFTSPFVDSGINREKADSVFYNAMVLNPSSEVYFLDTAGNVMYWQSPDTTIIQLHKISLENIKKFIYSEGSTYVTGEDPKYAGVKKIFSAAQVYKNDKLLGYIYVILGSSAYGNAANMLFSSQVWHLALEAFIVVIVLSILISLYYIKRLQYNYKRVIAVLEQYGSGNFAAQFGLKDSNEFAPITDAFNKMTVMLSTSMKKLQKSETDRKDLIATISHDLQSPLSIAKGYAETLLIKNDHLVLPEHREYLKLIQLKIVQVEKMVIQLTQLSKIEEVNFKPNKEPFVLSEIVQETVSTYQLIATERKITLKCAQCKYHVWVNADISMMERVIQNLVDNAVKNTPASGNVQVSITVEDQLLKFTIENSGKSLPDNLLRWVNSSEEELSDRPSRTGLGLLIVKKILRLHNISLHVIADENKNVFSFKVPVVSQPAV